MGSMKTSGPGFWIPLAAVITGLHFAYNGIPAITPIDIAGLAFIGVIVYWISRPSVRRKDAADS